MNTYWRSPTSSIKPGQSGRGRHNAGADPQPGSARPCSHYSGSQTSSGYRQSVQEAQSNHDQGGAPRPRYVRGQATDRPGAPAYWTDTQYYAAGVHVPRQIE